MYILLVQYASNVKTPLIEEKNPTLDSYYKLQNRYSDVKCPCSQLSSLYDSFAALIPIYHPICSSGFISQVWIEILVDNMTAFRYPGDFRATASTQFQVLRELCHFSQTVLNNNIRSFLQREFISDVLLSENRWCDNHLREMIVYISSYVDSPSKGNDDT